MHLCKDKTWKVKKWLPPNFHRLICLNHRSLHNACISQHKLVHPAPAENSAHTCYKKLMKRWCRDVISIFLSHRVEKYSVESEKWKSVSLATKKNSLLVNYLLEGHHYKFRIRAENQLGCSSWTETEVITAVNPANSPSSPRLIEASDTGKDFLSLTWMKPSNDGGSAITGKALVKQILFINSLDLLFQATVWLMLKFLKILILN